MKQARTGSSDVGRVSDLRMRVGEVVIRLKHDPDEPHCENANLQGADLAAESDVLNSSVRPGIA